MQVACYHEYSSFIAARIVPIILLVQAKDN